MLRHESGVAAYAYNGLEQLVKRELTIGGIDVTHFVHDRWGNVIAETDGSGPSGTVREYIWRPEAEIAPTFRSRAPIDRPLAVVDGVGGTSPQLWFVHVDHLHRPSAMTDAAKASVWSAEWLPWGAPHAVTGSAALTARFPGQWFQLEAGLHYNWHRHYDPTLGRYTQPDPLGFVDGPSVYVYARASPTARVDTDDLMSVSPGSTSSSSFGSQCRLAGLVLVGHGLPRTLRPKLGEANPEILLPFCFPGPLNPRGQIT